MESTCVAWQCINQLCFFLLKVRFYIICLCARCTSATKIFTVELAVAGLTNIFPYCSFIHFFTARSFWNATCNQQSQESCSLWEILFRLPLNIMIGQTREMPFSEGCKLHCILTLAESRAR